MNVFWCIYECFEKFCFILIDYKVVIFFGGEIYVFCCIIIIWEMNDKQVKMIGLDLDQVVVVIKVIIKMLNLIENGLGMKGEEKRV